MKKVLLSICSALLLFGLISCGSKPAAEEEKTPQAPEVTEVAETPVETVDTAEDDAAAEEAARLAKLEERRKAALEAFENAKAARDLIEENGWEKYDESDYENGCEKLDKVEEAYDATGTLDESLFDTALASYEDFKKVLDAAYKKMAKEERAAAYEAKQSADSVKAAVARKDDYTKAVDTFKQGDSHYVTKNPKASYECYKSAKETFLGLYDDLYEKRAAAQAALEAAKKAVEESAQFAEEADRVAPITEEIDGIEDEDTVLLEEDEYEDPEEAEADISSVIDGEEDEVETEDVIESEEDYIEVGEE